MGGEGGQPFLLTGWGKRSVGVCVGVSGVCLYKYIQIKNSINIICSFTKNDDAM